MFAGRGVRDAAGAAIVALALAGCGSDKTVPDVTGQRLDVVMKRLDAAGIDYNPAYHDDIKNPVSFEVCATEPPEGSKPKHPVILIVRPLGQCD